MRSRTHLILVPMALFAACQGDPQPTTDIPVQVEDSAGVRIVEYTGTPVADAPFRFSAEPLYRHGANPGDYAFQRIDAGRLFPDGSAVVSDGGNDELVVLSRDGETHELLAGPGEGPGDVSYVSAVFVLGQDTILATDRELLRVTIFAGGSVARIVDIRHLYGHGVQGTGSSGQLLVARDGFRFGFDEEWLPGHMARFDLDTGTLDTVAPYDFMPRTPPGLRWNPIGASGRVTVADGQFIYTRSDRPEITWRRPDGTVTQIVRWQAAQAPLTEELLGGVEAGLRERMRTANPGASDADIDDMTADDMAIYRSSIGGLMPLFNIPFGDADGRVWLPSYRPGRARAGAPEAFADAEGDFRSVIRYLCLNAEEREMGNVAPAHLVFWENPRPTAPAVPGSIITGPLELRTTWGDETAVLQARAVPVRNRIYLDRDDAKDRSTGESSDAEFVRRLLESPSTASDSLVIEPDWEEVGAVRYAYSLEGAANAIREAGRPCGVG